MSKYSNFPFKKLTFYSTLVLVFCFFSGKSFAQSEQDKIELDNMKPTERGILEENSIGQETTSTKNFPVKSAASASKPNAPKKEVLPSEGKKSEVIPSTLSFNIFLYIVDKFKAD